MSAHIYVISDLHLGHTNMAIKRGFSTVEEHDQHIIDKWNIVVSKHDTVWILGDLTMEKKRSYSLLNELRGIKKIVLGNHDLPQHVPELLKYVNSVCGMYTKMKGIILSHCPIHPDELRGKKCCHGHIHENDIMIDYEIPKQICDTHGINYNARHVKVRDIRYINVSCEAINYTPVRLDSII